MALSDFMSGFSFSHLNVKRNDLQKDGYDLYGRHRENLLNLGKGLENRLHGLSCFEKKLNSHPNQPQWDEGNLRLSFYDKRFGKSIQDKLQLNIQFELDQNNKNNGLIKLFIYDPSKKVNDFFKKYWSYVEKKDGNIISDLTDGGAVQDLDQFYFTWSHEKLPVDLEFENLLEKLAILFRTFCDLISSGNDAEIDRMNRIAKSMQQIVLLGPPGTSKTYKALQLAATLLEFPPLVGDERYDNCLKEFYDCQIVSPLANFTSNRGGWAIVQFHPAYHYEDFVRGIRVSTSNNGPIYQVQNGIFAHFCMLAAQNKQPFVLIIDEINRAHLAGVLGELIYAIEYRGKAVATPYEINGNATVMVPRNLYIIGTMNTADRSIGHIDYAVRRRFAFVPLLPDSGVIDNYYSGTNANLKSAAIKLFNAVKYLFEGEGTKLSADFYPDDVQPGHTYFLAKDCDELISKFIYQVLPLLREYIKDGVLKSGAELRINSMTISLDNAEGQNIVLAKLRGELSKFNAVSAAASGESDTEDSEGDIDESTNEDGAGIDAKVGSV